MSFTKKEIRQTLAHEEFGGDVDRPSGGRYHHWLSNTDRKTIHTALYTVYYRNGGKVLASYDPTADAWVAPTHSGDASFICEYAKKILPNCVVVSEPFYRVFLRKGYAAMILAKLNGEKPNDQA